MANQIAVGLLTHGDGAHVSAYLAALAAAPQCEKVYLADPDRRWNSSAERVLGDKLVAAYADPRELLEQAAPQLALVSMEARLAPPVIDAALESGAHVFAEKPSCVRVEDFRPLVTKADSKHRYLMLALANRINPEIQAARKIFAAGRIGKLFGVELHLVADQTRLTRPSYHQQWFADPSRAGGGHLIWLGIHWLDLAMFLTGESITQVAGFTANVGGQPIAIEDSAAAAYRFENGALGTITSGYYLDRGYHSHIKIWGSAGWILIEPMKDQPLSWYTSQGEGAGEVQFGDGVKEPRGYSPFVASALEAAATMSDPPITSGESLRALQTVFAIYSAAKSGRAVEIEAG